MKKKANRLDAIKMIISSKDVSSQEELLQALSKEGFELTQATLSRDLKQLYNKGVILAGEGDLTSAISCFNKAIELKPDFGEAFYNRGYVFLSLGNRDAAFADLSRAGGLGIVPSYNLLKRMSAK